MAKTIIVVGYTEIDEYGNLLVTDKGGGVTRIAKKRERLFTLFQQGQAVELDWQTYMNKDYVADAKLVEGALPPPVEPLSASVPVGSHSRETSTSKNRSYALSYVKDLAVADKIPVDKILSYAELFLRWLDGDIKVEDEEVFKSLLKKTFSVVETKEEP